MISRVVVLGSSFAAGPAIEPVVDAAAMRSGANYPSLVAGGLGASLVDLTSTGATISNVLSVPQKTLSGVVFEPQISRLPDSADLVLITTGGNDLRLSAPMVNHAAGYPVKFVTPSESKIEDVGCGLAAIVQVVGERFPDARCILVDYLPVLGIEPQSWQPWFTEEQGEIILETYEGLVEAYELAAELSGAQLVQASALGGHELGSVDPWITGLLPGKNLPGSFHPNAAGMKAVAQLVLESL